MSQSPTRPRSRPLSPHLSIWRWGPHMLVSILHRVTGGALATVGTIVFVWWLAALAGGPESYAVFYNWVVQREDGNAVLPGLANGLATITAIGLSWALFQHLANGIRHFVLDLGAGYELKVNRLGSLVTIGLSVTATVLMWAYIFLRGL